MCRTEYQYRDRDQEMLVPLITTPLCSDKNRKYCRRRRRRRKWWHLAYILLMSWTEITKPSHSLSSRNHRVLPNTGFVQFIYKMLPAFDSHFPRNPLFPWSPLGLASFFSFFFNQGSWNHPHHLLLHASSYKKLHCAAWLSSEIYIKYNLWSKIVCLSRHLILDS